MRPEKLSATKLLELKHEGAKQFSVTFQLSCLTVDIFTEGKHQLFRKGILFLVQNLQA